MNIKNSRYMCQYITYLDIDTHTQTFTQTYIYIYIYIAFHIALIPLGKV